MRPYSWWESPAHWQCPACHSRCRAVAPRARGEESPMELSARGSNDATGRSVQCPFCGQVLAHLGSLSLQVHVCVHIPIFTGSSSCASSCLLQPHFLLCCPLVSVSQMHCVTERTQFLPGRHSCFHILFPCRDPWITSGPGRFL